MRPRVRRLAGIERALGATTLGLAAAVAALVCVALWSAVAGRVVAFCVRIAGVGPELVAVPVLTAVLGPVAGSVLYARYRGFETGVRGPRRGTWPTAVGVIAAPAVLAAAASAVGNAAFGVPLSVMTGYWVSPDVGVRFLASRVAPPAVALGVGYAFVVCGVAVESVRSVVDADDVPAVAAVLVGYFRLLPVDVVARLPHGVGTAYELLTGLVFGVAFGAGVGVVYRARRAGRSAVGVDHRDMVVLAVAALGVVGAVTGLTSVGEVVTDALWIVVLGLAVVGYHRTRSVWVAALSLVVFFLSIRVLVYLEASLGLAVA